MAMMIWLMRFQLWFLCFTTSSSRQVEKGFAEAGEIVVSRPQRKIGEVVDMEGFRELGFLGRKMMMHDFSREDELEEGIMKNARRRISEKNKDSEKFNEKFEDHVSNKAEQTRLKSNSLSRSDKKPIVDARKTRETEEENVEDEEEKLIEDAENVAKVMRDDYQEISHSRPPTNNHQPLHFQENSKP